MSKSKAKQVAGNSLKWFVATLCREERSRAYVRIQAQSQEEAEQKADEFDTSEIMNWVDVVHAEEWVEFVKPQDENVSHSFPAIVEQVKEGGQNNE